ncbi:MAG: GNAT family N-acetyltransferase [Bdellovibrio sp.]|nr:GNAT family N-acetyltransferase [Bdellovibrio sp.]
MIIDYTNIQVATKRLIIRPLVESDYEQLQKSYAERLPKQSKYDNGPVDPKETPRAWFKQLIKIYRKRASDDQIYIFGVFHRKTGRHIGSVDIATIVRHTLSWANLGYYVHNNFQGQGYAKEFAKAAIQIAFKDLGFKRIEAAANTDNLPSINLAKSIGMKKECLRQNFHYDQGVWNDHVVFVMISKDKALHRIEKN